MTKWVKLFLIIFIISAAIALVPTHFSHDPKGWVTIAIIDLAIAAAINLVLGIFFALALIFNKEALPYMLAHLLTCLLLCAIAYFLDYL